MPSRLESEWQTIGGVPTPVSEDAARQQMVLDMARARVAMEGAYNESISQECRVQREPAPTEVQSHMRSIWDQPRPVFSNTPTRNCNLREEGLDTTIDPTFNNKMYEMLLASHVDIKELWRKK